MEAFHPGSHLLPESGQPRPRAPDNTLQVWSEPEPRARSLSASRCRGSSCSQPSCARALGGGATLARACGSGLSFAWCSSMEDSKAALAETSFNLTVGGTPRPTRSRFRRPVEPCKYSSSRQSVLTLRSSSMTSSSSGRRDLHAGSTEVLSFRADLRVEKVRVARPGGVSRARRGLRAGGATPGTRSKRRHHLAVPT